MEARPRVISFTLGDPGDLVQQAHDVGARVMVQVTTVAQAVQAAERCVDVIIAQGGESRYCGEVSTMALVPQVVDAVSPIPVVASGGIFDGRGATDRGRARPIGAEAEQAGQRVTWRGTATRRRPEPRGRGLYPSTHSPYNPRSSGTISGALKITEVSKCLNLLASPTGFEPVLPP